MLAILAFVVTLTSCATGKRPGHGDIAFRLLWSGQEDLDLHVEDAKGGELWFLSPTSESGGILDIDCNGNPSSMCAHPIENVFWPKGKAPDGTYRYWVELFQPRTKLPDTTFRLQVLLGTEVVREHIGTLGRGRERFGPFEFEYAGARDRGAR